MALAGDQLTGRRTTWAVLMAILGIGVLSVMDAAVKGIAANVPTWEIVFLRYAFGTAFALPAFLAGERRLPPLEILRAHFLRSIAVVLTALTFFYALGVLPLAVCLALSFTSPIMIALLARISLGERPGAGVLLAIGVGFLGVLTVLFGELQRSGGATLAGILAATVAAGTYAVSMVSLKARAARQSARHDRVPAEWVRGPAGGTAGGGVLDRLGCHQNLVVRTARISRHGRPLRPSVVLPPCRRQPPRRHRVHSVPVGCRTGPDLLRRDPIARHPGRSGPDRGRCLPGRACPELSSPAGSIEAAETSRAS